jgi:hypothetical protein
MGSLPIKSRTGLKLQGIAVVTKVRGGQGYGISNREMW